MKNIRFNKNKIKFQSRFIFNSFRTKNVSLLLILLAIVSCKEKTTEKQTDNQATKDSTTFETIKDTLSSASVDSTTWMDSFREFRSAVFEGNRTKVKTFIDFPILNEQNEIWYLVAKETNKDFPSSMDTIKPFPETYFDKYFEKIFPRSFANSIQKIKTEELLRKGEYETIELKANGLSYKTFAEIDKEKNELRLNVAYYTPKNEKTADQEGMEYNVIYYFSILPNKQIKFKQIKMAG